MTTINIATDIPSQIETLEQLHAWTAYALFAINPTITVIEGVGYTERVAQCGKFWVAADAKSRLISRTSLEVSSDELSGSAKPWMYVQPISNTAIPSSFKAN
ncbi:glucose-6-phosphate dehydrogenase [Nostoc sp. UCD121]|uniref:glucose-6-phosphate dehydrogenase n=1 Tax=unclassified Nostoc TaxID=2593658 RepID=UPI00162322DE|nr:MULTISPECIES: glucose-6-phosphate dehydrogenase [unclassified Nostoc]MBC1218481.1 glucose-6-phosphate dehydrogenase [Nostoc sp. UCD120]MBC1277681.1 glucose-6-phosphate dehydrogenase [Nostoc sp. UCD121]MBC1296199.1 glucose-6-phosphate dehydrogenase [Nostoc sp. UCD122]